MMELELELDSVALECGLLTTAFSCVSKFGSNTLEILLREDCWTPDENHPQ
jgi:hypothetical protein